jgi:hypothetical protein
MPLPVPWQVADLDRFAVAIRRDFLRRDRAWPHEAHIPPQDAQQLRQLIQGSGPKYASNPCDQRGVGVTLIGHSGAVGIRHHRPELEGLEESPALADSSLTEEDGPPVIELDRNRDQDPNGKGDREPCKREGGIEDPLGKRIG